MKNGEFLRALIWLVAAGCMLWPGATRPLDEVPLAALSGIQAVHAGHGLVIGDPSAWLLFAAFALVAAATHRDKTDMNSAILFAVSGMLAGAALAIVWPGLRQGLPPLPALVAGLAGAAGLRASMPVLCGAGFTLGAGLSLYLLPSTGAAGAFALAGLAVGASAGFAIPAKGAMAVRQLLPTDVSAIALRAASAWLAAVALLVLALDFLA